MISIGEERSTASFDGTRICYYCKKQEKTPLVFIHGSGNNYSEFQKCIDYFSAKGHTIIAPDLRGFGNSEAGDASDISIKNYAKDVYEVLLKERIDSAIIVGHCLGASVAVEFSKLHPKITQGLVLITPFSSWTTPFTLFLRFLGSALMFLSRIIPIKRKLKRQGYEDFKRTPWLFHPLTDLKGTSVVSFFGSVNALLGYFLDFNEIIMPCLIILGRFDILSNNRKILKEAEKNSNITVRIVNATHVIVSKKDDEIIKIMEGFIKTNN